MVVKLTECFVGGERTWEAGDEFECSAEEAKRLIEAGFAVPVPTKKETASKAVVVEAR